MYRDYRLVLPPWYVSHRKMKEGNPSEYIFTITPPHQYLDTKPWLTPKNPAGFHTNPAVLLPWGHPIFLQVTTPFQLQHAPRQPYSFEDHLHLGPLPAKNSTHRTFTSGFMRVLCQIHISTNFTS
jgi:hypothetical protein